MSQVTHGLLLGPHGAVARNAHKFLLTQLWMLDGLLSPSREKEMEQGYTR